VVLQGSIAQSNIFGSGKYVGINLSTGSVNRNISLSYLNPYFTVDGVSQGFDVYNRKVNASNLALSPYTTDTYGGGVKFGYPLSETDAVSFGLNAEDVTLGLFPNSAPAYLNFQSLFGDHYVYGSGTIGWARDQRDSAILPSRGYTTRIGAEVAGGDLEYYRLNAGQTNYFPLSRTMTLSLTGNVGYVNGLGGKPVPFFKDFYAGGPGSVRGYRAYSLGPQDSLGNSLGGTKSVTASAEIYFPVPGAQQDKSLRLTAFIDGGQVYDSGSNINGNVSGGGPRYSAGVGISWNSPFGPLKLSLGQPLNAKSGFDHIERLQFQFGTAF